MYVASYDFYNDNSNSPIAGVELTSNYFVTSELYGVRVDTGTYPSQIIMEENVVTNAWISNAYLCGSAGNIVENNNFQYSGMFCDIDAPQYSTIFGNPTDNNQPSYSSLRCNCEVRLQVYVDFYTYDIYNVDMQFSFGQTITLYDGAKQKLLNDPLDTTANNNKNDKLGSPNPCSYHDYFKVLFDDLAPNPNYRLPYHHSPIVPASPLVGALTHPSETFYNQMGGTVTAQLSASSSLSCKGGITHFAVTLRPNVGPYYAWPATYTNTHWHDFGTTDSISVPKPSESQYQMK